VLHIEEHTLHRGAVLELSELGRVADQYINYNQ
jgi:hypothetical protein